MTMNRIMRIAALLAALAWSATASAQTALVFRPLGQCQITSLTAATLITGANCTRASFTGTGAGTNLTVSAVTGVIQAGDQLAGTGVPSGTFIVSGPSGGGAGVYVTNNPTTSSAAALTSGGVPNGATLAVLSVEGAAVRYRDDGQAPTASVGMPLAVGQAVTYQATLSAALSNLQFIQQAASATLDCSFYR
jgi:hypothetical protein